MTYDILAVHVDFQLSGDNEVRVAVATNDGWRAYKNNNKPLSGYPIHDTSKLNDDMFQSVASSGLKMDPKEAKKYFPGLSPKKFEW